MGKSIIEKAIEGYVDDYNLNKTTQKKLIKIWTLRACRFFVENELDCGTVEEDSDKDNLKYNLKYEKGRVENY